MSAPNSPINFPPTNSSCFDRIWSWAKHLNAEDLRLLASQGDCSAGAMLRWHQGHRMSALRLLHRLTSIPPERCTAHLDRFASLWWDSEVASSASGAPPDQALKHHPNWRIRWLLARNPQCSDHALEWLASDMHYLVRLAVIRNARASASLLDSIERECIQVLCARPDHSQALSLMKELLGRSGWDRASEVSLNT